MPFAATWMQPEMMLSEVRKKKTNTIYHLYVELQKRHKLTYLQNKKWHTGIENRLGVGKGKLGRDRAGIWGQQMQTCTWIWANSGRQWKTEESGMLPSMGSQRVGYDLARTRTNYIYRMDKQQGPTMKHRNYIQHPVLSHNGKEYKKECTYV